MVTENPDRVEHAGLPGGGAIVRYQRAGKYFLEYPDGDDRHRRQLTLNQAAALAEANEKLAGGFVALGRPGGLAFDARFRTIRSITDTNLKQAEQLRTKWLGELDLNDL